MKKLIFTFIVIACGFGLYGQKIGNLDVSTSAPSNSRMLINDDPTGNKLESITKANFLSDVGDYLDTVSISSIAPLLTDTVPIATFGAGTGLIADTALFNNGVLIGSFYNEGSDTLVITQLMGVMKEGTGTETISVQFSWHATFLSGSATSLNAAALAITSLTTGTSDVSFANSKIPPNVFVWGILSGASKDNKPTFLSVTLSGYKIPGY